MSVRSALARVIEGVDLDFEDMAAAMREIMTGEATPAQIGGFLAALRMKGETVTELTAAAQVMRELATRVRMPDTLHERLVDVVGTGGDGANLFNVSTAAAFVVAAAGGLVAKHGNRSVSSRTGSADLLEAAGVALDLDPEAVARCISEVGVGFMFAPRYHSAMRHAVGPRREMGVRTLFNLIGPVTNPALAPRQLTGVFDGRWLEDLAQVLKRLGSQRALVVHSEDGLDEISPAAPTDVAELRDGEVHTYRLQPDALGLERCALDSLRIDDAEASLALIRGAFAGEAGPARTMIALNAGATLYVAGLADDIAAGVARAQAMLDSGEAQRRMDALARLSQQLRG